MLHSLVEPEAEADKAPVETKGQEEETTKLGRTFVKASPERVNQIKFEAGAANSEFWAM